MKTGLLLSSVVLLFILGSCSHSTELVQSSNGPFADTLVAPPPTGPSGSFMFTIANDTANRTKYWKNCKATATMDQVHGSNGQKRLSIDLDFIRSDYSHRRQLSINFLLMSNPVRKYMVGSGSDEVGIGVTTDTESFDSRTGALLITKLDTTLNLISGYFRFVAVGERSNSLDTIIGYFNEVEITHESFGQGTVNIMLADSSSFTSFHGSNYLIAELIDSLLTISYSSDTSPRQFALGVNNPKLGSFVLSNGFKLSQASIQYSSLFIDGTSKSGNLVISKFDTATRRISGTFSGTLHGTKDIEMHGTMDNVQWTVP